MLESIGNFQMLDLKLFSSLLLKEHLFRKRHKKNQFYFSTCNADGIFETIKLELRKNKASFRRRAEAKVAEIISARLGSA